MGSEGKRVEVAERLERAVDELRGKLSVSRLRCAVDEFLEVWDEAVAEGRPALVGEDAEAPVAGGPTDKFDAGPSEEAPDLSGKLGPVVFDDVVTEERTAHIRDNVKAFVADCCTDDEDLSPDDEADLFDEEDNEDWDLDVEDDIETLREELADLRKRFEKHIGL